MAKQFRVIEANDLDPKSFRRKKRRRLRKGDYIRISKATSKSVNLVLQQFGIKEKNVRLDEVSPDIKGDIVQSSPNLHKI